MKVVRHLPIQPRTSTALRLAWLEAVARGSSVQDDGQWTSVEARLKEHANNAEVAELPMRLDETLTAASEDVTATYGKKKPWKTVAARLRKNVERTDCSKCATGLSPCDGSNADHDDEVAANFGSCFEGLRLVFDDVAAEAATFYATVSQRLGASLSPVQLCLGTGTLATDPIKMGLAGEYRSDVIRLRFGKLFRHEGALQSYQAIPYLFAHEVFSHAYWARALAAKPPLTAASDRFAEGWMDRAAQVFLGRVKFSKESRERMQGMTTGCSDASARYAFARCDTAFVEGRDHETECTFARVRGREAAENFLRLLCDVLGEKEGEDCWLEASAAWNLFGLRTNEGTTRLPGYNLMELATDAVYQDEVSSLELVTQVRGIVRTKMKTKDYLVALEELFELANKWVL